jgi:hypothetical protein
MVQVQVHHCKRKRNWKGKGKGKGRCRGWWKGTRSLIALLGIDPYCHVFHLLCTVCTILDDMWPSSCVLDMMGWRVNLLGCGMDMMGWNVFFPIYAIWWMLDIYVLFMYMFVSYMWSGAFSINICVMLLSKFWFARVNSQIIQNSKGKSARANFSVFTHFNTVKCTSLYRVNSPFDFKR